MNRSLRQVEPTVHLTDEATLDALGKTISREQIEQVLKPLGIATYRKRKLTFVLVTLLCIAMCLYTEEAIDDVLVKLMQGPRFLRPMDEIVGAGQSAICQRRQQLGVVPMARLFRQVCQPLSTTDTPGAFLFGLRLMAIDGTKEDIADTPANARYFGRPGGGRGDGAFPQVQAIYFCECGSHAICDAGFWPCHTSEHVGGLRMLRSVGPGMLVLWDRGLYNFDMFQKCLARQAHFLCRLHSRANPKVVEHLNDGSFLAFITPSDYWRRKNGERLLVRIIRYTIDDPGLPGYGEKHSLITSLLDQASYPAHTLACAYHQRWEVEITIDEMDTHQRYPKKPLRSRTPLGVLQELYGFLLAHYAIRKMMHEAALQAGLSPLRLSFIKTVRILRNAVFEFQIVSETQLSALRKRLMTDIARTRLPERKHRSNPRVVKRKMSNFDKKREHHRNWPQPTKPFPDAVVLLI
jgi:hypothetical protein